jgi:ribosome-associated protein
VSAAQEKKGHNLTVINLEGQCSYTDYLVIISANNERQTSAIAEAISDNLKTTHGLRPMFREGQGGWILLDYGDVVVHVFVEDARAHYDLDRLWPEAPRVQVPSAGDEPEEVAAAVPARMPAFAARRRR